MTAACRVTREVGWSSLVAAAGALANSFLLALPTIGEPNRSISDGPVGDWISSTIKNIFAKIKKYQFRSNIARCYNSELGALSS